jgi:molybdopterin converting factor small subunit
MARIVFTSHLERYLDCASREIEANSVASALEQVFEDSPRLRSYILDDQGILRQHITIFVNGQVIRDRKRLSDPVGENGEIYVLQALSGG